MRLASDSIWDSSESKPPARRVLGAGAGLCCSAACALEPDLRCWRCLSASSTACFLATSLAAAAARARARASAASRATRSFSLSIWLSSFSNGDGALGAGAGLPSSCLGAAFFSMPARRARSASRRARSCSTASRRARSSSAFFSSASFLLTAASDVASSVPSAVTPSSASSFLRTLAT